jgi:hypothetical protein
MTTREDAWQTSRSNFFYGRIIARPEMADVNAVGIIISTANRDRCENIEDRKEWRHLQNKRKSKADKGKIGNGFLR